MKRVIMGLVPAGLWLLIASTLLAGASDTPPASSAAFALTKAQSETTSEVEPSTPIEGVWQAPDGLRQIAIWPKAAPSSDDWSVGPEKVLTRTTPEALEAGVSQAAFDVSVPTVTIFPPRGHNSGVAVIVFPGGGFRGVAITLEGTEICRWVASKGMTCVLSKYRVPGSNHYWNADCRCHLTPKVPRALQDAQRSIRWVRAHADELQIEPNKVGVMGFSAGGYLGAQTSNIIESSYPLADAIDRFSSRPDFAALFFPGHLCRNGATVDPGMKVSASTPPTFLVMAWDDPTNRPCNSSIYARELEAAGVPAELHFFAVGGHAFGLRRHRSPDTVWPLLLENWLRDIGMLAAATG